MSSPSIQPQHLTSSTVGTTPPTDKQIQYAKLGGIDANLFNNPRNAGLSDFIEANVLHKKMAQQGHVFSSNAEGDILIKYNGVDVPWSQIKKDIDSNLIKHDGNNKLTNTYYTYQGLVIAPDISNLDIDAATLDDLLNNAVVVFKYDDPQKWNNEYVMTIVTHSHPSGPEKEKEHSWLHFKDPQGRILSIGIYRTKPGMSTQPGRVEHVDSYESYKEARGARDECDIRVTKQQWECKLRHLLKMSKEPFAYHQIHGTCATHITKTFNDITKSEEFKSGLHVTELAQGKQAQALQFVPSYLKDYIGSYFVKGATKAMNIDTLKAHEFKQAKLDTLTTEQRDTLQNCLHAVSADFAKLSAQEQSQIDHPFQLRKKGLEIAAYRLEKIHEVQEMYRDQIRVDDEKISNSETKQQFAKNYEKDFENTRNHIMLDLPPVGWTPTMGMPEKHPDYHSINLQSDLSKLLTAA